MNEKLRIEVSLDALISMNFTDFMNQFDAR